MLLLAANRARKLKDIIIDTDLIYTNKEYSKIKTVSSLGNQMTYDLTTEKYHNYFELIEIFDL